MKARGAWRRFSRRCGWLVALIVVVSTGLAAPVAQARTASTPTASGSQWRQYPAPSINGEQMYLESVSAGGPSDVWAVGYMWTDVGGALEFRTVTDHWDGRTWTMVPSPDRETAPAVDFLYGVSAASATNVWAVGVSSPNGQPSSTLVLHWTGSSWAIVATPNPGANGNSLAAVSAGAGYVWAVGSSSEPALNEVPLVLREDTKGWHTDPFAIPSVCYDNILLTGVDALSPTSVLASGTCGIRGGGSRGFVAQRSAHGWSVVATTRASGAQDRLNAVAGTGADVWAVGDSTVPGGTSKRSATAIHRTGHTWQQLNPPAVGLQPSLAGVASRIVNGQGVVLAAGVTTTSAEPAGIPLILRRDGNDWDQEQAPGWGIPTAVALEPTGRAWVVGSRSGQPLILGRGP